ncbi:MAG: HypC/HybG/HupF family hydrogenase formation chaperone [Deltaproteobacteria bacterium]|nr:HypC/HybG/HupF family hydrogenase formation chaperone [Deltaproteobacteria bacterium]
MCLAVPMKIISLEADSALCEIDDVRRRASVTLIEDPRIGDYVLVHAGYAIEKLIEKEAEETLSLFREMSQAPETPFEIL